MLPKQKWHSQQLHHRHSFGADGLAIILTGIISFTLALPSLAEIYRWTDENGKVHFSDRPPRDRKAEDISDSAHSVNVDNSSEERKKLTRLFAKETEEEKQLRLEQEQKLAAEKEQREQDCAKAREDLVLLQRGRVYRVDDTGETGNVSEEERQQAVDRLTAAIARHCQ